MDLMGGKKGKKIVRASPGEQRDPAKKIVFHLISEGVWTRNRRMAGNRLLTWSWCFDIEKGKNTSNRRLYIMSDVKALYA
jgi:hypothetical protein